MGVHSRCAMVSTCKEYCSLRRVCTLVKAVAAFAVDLVCGHVDEAPHAPVHAARLQQHMRAIGVVDGECEAVAKAVVHVSLQGAQSMLLEDLLFGSRRTCAPADSALLGLMLPCARTHVEISYRYNHATLLHGWAHLRCKVEDCVYLLRAEQVRQEVSALQIPLRKLRAAEASSLS